jgi:hypothetical protein
MSASDPSAIDVATARRRDVRPCDAGDVALGKREQDQEEV